MLVLRKGEVSDHAAAQCARWSEGGACAALRSSSGFVSKRRLGACRRARPRGMGRAPGSGVESGRETVRFLQLETAEDVHALAGVLRKHRDATGRRPSIVMNFIMANVDLIAISLARRSSQGMHRFLCACSPKGCREHGIVRNCSRPMRRAFASGCFIRRCMG